ncbi:MAG: DUF2156 domain-containing protein [Christensenellales bacterium]|jgi:hypothetical protein
MLSYKEIELRDREWMDKLFDMGERGSLEYSFTTNFLWRYAYGHRVARMDNYLILKMNPQSPRYLFPPGHGDLEPVIEALTEEAAQNGVPLRFGTVLAPDKARLETMYPGRFAFESLRDGADYVYEAQSLASLQGKKLAGKRNHIRRFLDNHPDWRYEPIAEENINEVRRMILKWCIQVGCGDNNDLSDEFCAVEQALRHFRALRLTGGLIRADGEVIAFSIGDALSTDTYHVHFEKAFGNIQGAYPMINQQFVLNNCMDYAFVNREEDAGVPGLRKAKLSYNPHHLVEKYCAIDTTGGV